MLAATSRTAAREYFRNPDFGILFIGPEEMTRDFPQSFIFKECGGNQTLDLGEKRRVAQQNLQDLGFKRLLHADILPTLADIAGADITDLKLEGRSLAPLLKDNSTKWPDRTLFFHGGRSTSAHSETFGLPDVCVVL